jgi:hypothetical protein
MLCLLSCTSCGLLGIEEVMSIKKTQEAAVLPPPAVDSYISLWGIFIALVLPQFRRLIYQSLSLTKDRHFNLYEALYLHC